MSRSQIACAFDTGSTTIARVKSTSTGSFAMTMCRTIDGGLDELSGAKGKRLAKKIVSMLKQWHSEPVALSFSPPEIRTLPAWFPDEITAEKCNELCRIEAGYFLHNVEAWRWHDMIMSHAAEQDNKLTRRMLLFYPSTATIFIERELQQHHEVSASGVHLEALARLPVGNGESLAVLELETHYAALSVSVDGKPDYFRYWPVTGTSERDYFVIAELTRAPIGDTPVKVTGSAANAKALERLSRETTHPLEALELHEWVTADKRVIKSKSATATMRAVSTALMALNSGMR